MVPKIHTAEEDQLALTSAIVRDLLCIAAFWDLFRYAVIIPLFAAHPKNALIFVLVKSLLVVVIPFLLWRSGRVHPAAWFVSVAMAGLAAVYILLSGGIRSSTTVVLVAMTVTATILLGRRGALALGLPSLVFLTGLAIFQGSGGHLPHVFDESYWIYFFTVVSGASVAVVPVMRAVGRITSLAAERRAQRNRLRAILDSDPECVKLLDAQGRLLEINPAGLAFMEADSPRQVIGANVTDMMDPEYREAFLDLNRRVFAGESGTLEFRITGRKGTRRWLETHSTPLRDGNGQIVAALGVTRDITVRKQLETEIGLANALLVRVQAIAQIGHFTRDLAAGGAECSAECFRIFGLPVPESPGRWQSDSDLQTGLGRVLDGNGERVRVAFENLQDADITYRLHRTDGQIRYLHVKASRESNQEGQPVRLLGVIQDVTEHRQVQEHLQRLTARLETIREEEQRRIAREIHDELGQQLTGLKMRAAWVGHLMDSSAQRPLTDAERAAAARAEMAGIGEALESAIRTVRRIATELRPPVLDTLGLIPALESLRENFKRDHSIECVTHFEEVKVSPQVATAVFRVTQEALTNIAKHAGATRVRMSLVQQEASLILDVQDNGPGLPADAAPKPDAWGLIGMQERARTVNGGMEFLRPPGGGLTVRMIVPCQPVEEWHGAVSDR